MENPNISGLNIDSNEYCTVIGNQYYSNKKFKVKVTKLTPFTLPTGKKVFNSHILVNDNDVRPSVSKSVTCQNYMTIEKSASCNLIGITNSNNMVPNGTILKCRCQNNDFTTMTIVDSKI